MSPVLDLRGVDVRLSGRMILDGVNLSLGDGEFTGLIGSNGAGKTTLLKAVLGLIDVDAGEVLIAGRPRAGRPRDGRPRDGRPRSGRRPGFRAARRSPEIGYVPQKIDLDPDVPLRARDLVGLGIDGHRLGLSRRSVARSQAVEEALTVVGAEAFADARVGRLSGGEQQRVMIAHALVGQPRLLLLDEPLANLDISSVNDIVSVLARISSQQGVAILMSAHDMNPLLPVMDRIAYMAEGRVVAGRTDEIVRTEVLTELYRHPVEVLRVQGRVLVVSGA